MVSGTSGGFGNRDDGIRVLNSTDSVYDLQLVDWEDALDVPTSGCNVVIVGTDNNGVLHIKIRRRWQARHGRGRDDATQSSGSDLDAKAATPGL